jgi:thiol-disulfide isomerase/thioredoxin/outer membrane lipoprotein-sorting protein
MRIAHLALAAILACSASAVPAEPDRPVKIDPSKVRELLRPREGPGIATTGPATRPALGSVAEDARPLLERMAAAYTRLKSLELAGTLTLIVDDEHEKRTHQASFTGIFAAPNRFRHQAEHQPLIISNGTRVHGYIPRRNLFTVADAPPGRAMLSRYSRDINQILPEQNLSLVLAISSDPVTELREAAVEITRAPDQPIGQAVYPALKMSFADKTSFTLLVDPHTNLLRQVIADYTPTLHRQGRPDVRSATYTVDYTTVKPDPAIADDAFAWAPPSGARDIVAAAAGELLEGDESASPLIGLPAPDFTLQDMEGNNITLSELRGNVILLDFWATWCGPCIAAMPHIDKLHQDYKDQPVRILAINQREEREKVEPFLRTRKLTLPVLLDTSGDVGKAYGVRGIPTTVIIGRDGTILNVKTGFAPGGEQALKQLLEDALGEQ